MCQSGLPGWVRLEGATQTLDGTTFTLFNNLELKGTGIKQLTTVDTEIEDVLALNDREFAANDFTVFVTGTGTGLVTRTNVMTGGFVSSTNNGGLSRNMLAASVYVFPVGSTTGITRYRPVDITPNSAAAHTFKVRMANVNATAEGFDLTVKDPLLCIINPDYYHRIFRTGGASPADIKIYYDASADGSYQTIAHWQNIPEWEDTGGNTAGTGPAPFSSLTKRDRKSVV